MAVGKILVILLIARVLGAEGQGIYAFALALWAMSSILASLGMEVANNYFGAKQQEYSTATLLGNSLAFSLVSGVAAGAVLFGLTKTPIFPSDFVPYAVSLGIGVPITTATVSLAGLLVGNSGFLEKLLADTLLYSGCLATIIYLAAVGSIGNQNLLLYWLVWQTISTLVIAFALLRITGFRVSFDFAMLKEQMRYGARVYVYNGSTALNLRVDALLIAYFLGPAALGLYSVAVAATEAILYMPKALMSVFLTVVSTGEQISVRTYHAVFTLLVLMGAACTMAAFATFPYVLGPQFTFSASLVAVLVPGTVGLGMGSLAAYHLFGFGKSGLPTKAAIVSAAFVVTADVALIPYLGLWGAALAATLAYTMFGLLNLRFLARETGVRTTDFLKFDVVYLYRSLQRMSGPLRRWSHGQS